MKMNKRRFRITIEDIKAVFSIILIAIILFGPWAIAGAIAGYIECHYTVKTTIVAIEDNVYTVEAKNGHQFQFTVEDYQVGDEVKLYMKEDHNRPYEEDTLEKVRFKDGNTFDMN
jgi:hypothetical protein